METHNKHKHKTQTQHSTAQHTKTKLTDSIIFASSVANAAVSISSAFSSSCSAAATAESPDIGPNDDARRNLRNMVPTALVNIFDCDAAMMIF